MQMYLKICHLTVVKSTFTFSAICMDSKVSLFRESETDNSNSRTVSTIFGVYGFLSSVVFALMDDNCGTIIYVSG